MAKPTESPRSIVTAAQAAFTRLQKTNPTVFKALTDAYIKAGLHDSFDVQVALNRLPAGADKTALHKFFASPAALGLAISDAIKPGIQGIGDVIGKGAGIVGTLPQNVGDAVGKGLVSTVEPLAGIAGVLSTLTQRSTWLRIAEGLLGLTLVGIGVLAITRSTPAGKAIESGVKTAAKVVK
jgi:hypothetical protein